MDKLQGMCAEVKPVQAALQGDQNFIEIDDRKTANHAGHLPSLNCAARISTKYLA